jgi:epoxyqueuosine reductase
MIAIMPIAQNHGRRDAAVDFDRLAGDIRTWGRECGFDRVGIAGTDLDEHERRLRRWLDDGFHGEMDWMARHGTRRSRPAELQPGTVRVISARMHYLPPGGADPGAVLADPATAYISRYALGRDYHKLVRRRLQRLADRIAAAIGPFGYRVFTDSAPVLEKALAEKAGLGWIGKHTNLIAADAGSWFFLGEIYTDLPLPADAPAVEHCGSCHACIDACPTGAIVGPWRLDARRCISYLTIELRGPIPAGLRPLIGNRIFGCDDCQLVCPWNRFARMGSEGDFRPRHGLDAPALGVLFAWSEAEYLHYTEGSALRRVGYEGWLRNIAVALGNALRGAGPVQAAAIIEALRGRVDDPSPLVREHVQWALAQSPDRTIRREAEGIA